MSGQLGLVPGFRVLGRCRFCRSGFRFSASPCFSDSALSCFRSFSRFVCGFGGGPLCWVGLRNCSGPQAPGNIHQQLLHKPTLCTLTADRASTLFSTGSQEATPIMRIVSCGVYYTWSLWGSLPLDPNWALNPKTPKP